MSEDESPPATHIIRVRFRKQEKTKVYFPQVEDNFEITRS